MKEKDRFALLNARTAVAEKSEEKEAAPKIELKIGHARDKTAFERSLMHAGIKMSAKLYIALVLLGGFGVAMLLNTIGAFLGIFGGMLFGYYLMVWYPEERAQKRKRKVVRELAPFIDSLASAMATGFNVDGAIIQATASVPPGLLREELNRVCNGLNAGFTLKESMQTLRERVPGQEITSLIVSLNLFSSMGGVVLDPFRRLAIKIREQQVVVEKASRDLVMVKQSFYLLFFLSLGVPPILLLVEPDYLSNALKGGLSAILFQFGVFLVLLAIATFKKVTNLKM